MALRLGIDTGGTFTDAVLLDTEKGVLASSKALTTYANLFTGIDRAVSELLEESPLRRQPLTMVGLSTTLATNAMVENHGRTACLVHIGQPDQVIHHPALNQALGEDSTIRIAGGHHASGEQQQELNLDALRAAIQDAERQVDSYAVAGYFAVRNPSHELAARKVITELTGLPVTCSHELTSRLDAPRRALTCLFNARLIPMLASLISSVEKMLEQHAINAPVMVVQGDGSLVHAVKALQKPVDTILSGPAASLHGARYLTRIENAIVADIGGTTTDVAMLEDGAPGINQDGAMVGGWQTMVEAVNVNTRGLGGDSEVLLRLGVAQLSAERAIPVCQLAVQYPQVSAMLCSQLENDIRETDSRFAVRLQDIRSEKQFRSGSEKRIYELLSDGPRELNTLLESPSCDRALQRLRRRGIVNLSAFTPTDALHVTGGFRNWDTEAAENSARLLCRLIERQTGRHTGISELARQVIVQVIDKTCRVLLETAVMHTYGQRTISRDMNADRLSEILLEQPGNIFFDSRIRFKQPIVAIGAPAAMFYPQAAKRFDCECVIPSHAGVCNAIGAATSRVLQKTHALVTSPGEGIYRVHSSRNIQDFQELDAALGHARHVCREQAEANARDAGGHSITSKVGSKEVFVSGPGDYRLFMESRVTATAEGEPAGHQ